LGGKGGESDECINLFLELREKGCRRQKYREKIYFCLLNFGNGIFVEFKI
jgi:hypothetical protein